MSSIPLQYITDSRGKQVAVVLPIEFWNSLFPSDFSNKIMLSKKMKERLFEAMNRDNGYTIGEVRETLGI